LGRARVGLRLSPSVLMDFLFRPVRNQKIQLDFIEKPL
jgi:hypothetical protein